MEIVLVVMVVFSVVIVAWLTLAQAGEPPAPGKAAPEFRLPGTDGAEHSLSDLRGGRVHIHNPQAKAFHQTQAAAIQYRVVFIVKQEVLFDPIQIRFLSPVGVILQPQPITDLVQESFFLWEQASPGI